MIASPAAEAEGEEWRRRVRHGRDIISLDWLLECSAQKAHVRLCPRHYLTRNPAAIAADPLVDCYGDECGPLPALHGAGGRMLLGRRWSSCCATR